MSPKRQNGSDERRILFVIPERLLHGSSELTRALTPVVLPPKVKFSIEEKELARKLTAGLWG